MDEQAKFWEASQEFRTNKEIEQWFEIRDLSENNLELSRENEVLKAGIAVWKVFFTISFVANAVFVAHWLIDAGVVGR